MSDSWYAPVPCPTVNPLCGLDDRLLVFVPCERLCCKASRFSLKVPFLEVTYSVEILMPFVWGSLAVLIDLVDEANCSGIVTESSRCEELQNFSLGVMQRANVHRHGWPKSEDGTPIRVVHEQGYVWIAPPTAASDYDYVFS